MERFIFFFSFFFYVAIYFCASPFHSISTTTHPPGCQGKHLGHCMKCERPRPWPCALAFLDWDPRLCPRTGRGSRRFTLLAGIQTVADCLPRPRLWLAMTSGRLARCLDKWSRMPPPFGNAVPFEGGKPMVKGGARLVHPFVPNLCTCFVCIVLPVAARRRYAMRRC